MQALRNDQRRARQQVDEEWQDIDALIARFASPTCKQVNKIEYQRKPINEGLSQINPLFIGFFRELKKSILDNQTSKSWTAMDEEITEALSQAPFEIDNPRFSNTLSIGGVAVSITSSVRSEKKNRAWAEINLSSIADDISVTAGLALIYDTDVDPFYGQADQNDKSDLDFLEELCKSDGLCMKVTDGQLIVYEESKYDAESAVAIITKGNGNIVGNPSFSRDAKDTYKAGEIQYYCPKTDETYVGYFEAQSAPEVGHTLKLRENYNSESDDINLDRKAKARLREKNKYEWICNITLKGDIIYFTGTNLELVGWGKFDRKYYIDTSHPLYQ